MEFLGQYGGSFPPGFERQSDKSLWWGTGSTVWGHTVRISGIGDDDYRVVYRHWDFNCNGDCLADEHTEAVFHGELLIEFLSSKLPNLLPSVKFAIR